MTFEGDLVGDLLFEVQGQVGALPLLQFTLDQLFQRRSGSQLTLSAYREIGGVKGALARHAESIYTALPSEKHRTLARSLFLRLIDPGVTEQDTTRRRAALAELSLPDPEQTAIIQETADAFVAARLLTINAIAGTTTIEVSHEALMREWARLAEWLREAREDITLQQAISEDATEWTRHGKPIDRLYRGAQLTEAQEWARRNLPSADEIAFLQTSAADHQQREAAEQIRQARELTLQRQAVHRLRLLVATFSIFTVVAIVLSLLAGGIFLQAQSLQKRAQMQAQIALSHSLAANADDPRSYQFRAGSLALSPDGRLLAASVCSEDNIGCYAHQIILWDVATDTLIDRPPFSQAEWDILDLAFSPDGNTLAWSTGAGISLWNVATRKLIGHTLSISSETKLPGYYNHIAFSSNGKILVSAGSIISSFSFDSSFILWDVTTFEPFTSPIEESAYNVLLVGVAISPNGQQLVSVGFAGSLSSGAYPNQGIVTLWNMSLESWEHQACSIANRNLTKEEWTQFVGSEPFGKVCSDLPLS